LPAADHAVGPGVAIEDVVPAVAVERVAQAVAVALQAGRALQDQVFHVRGEAVVDRGIDRVDALVGILDHRVEPMVDEIRIVRSFR